MLTDSQSAPMSTQPTPTPAPARPASTAFTVQLAQSPVHNPWKYIAIILLVLLVTLVVLVAYLFQTQPKSVVSITTPTSIPTPAVTPVTEETANWITYINTVNKYSFKYPPNWVVRSYGGSNIPVEKADSYVMEGPYEDAVTLKGTPKYAIRVETLNTKPSTMEPNVVVKDGANGGFVIFTFSSVEIPPSSNPDTRIFDLILSTFELTSSGSPQTVR